MASDFPQHPVERPFKAATSAVEPTCLRVPEERASLGHWELPTHAQPVEQAYSRTMSNARAGGAYQFWGNCDVGQPIMAG